jgi:hypothetical protein
MKTRSPTLVALLMALLALSSSCATLPPLPEDPKRPYDTGDLTMLVRYRAKETCSCAFVMARDDAFCKAFTEASPSVAGVNIDRKTKTTSASALLLWSASARFVDDRRGCVIDDPDAHPDAHPDAQAAPTSTDAPATG